MKQAYISYTQNYPHYPQCLYTQNRCFVKKVWKIMWKTLITYEILEVLCIELWIRLLYEKLLL